MLLNNQSVYSIKKTHVYTTFSSFSNLELHGHVK